MVFIGIALIMFHLTILATNGFKKDFEDMTKVEELVKGIPTEENTKVLYKIIIKMILFIVLSLSTLFCYGVFLIAAISVDIYVIPTLIMMTLFVGDLILSFTKMKKDRNKDKEKNSNPFKGLTPKSIFINVLKIGYIGYILFLVLI